MSKNIKSFDQIRSMVNNVIMQKQARETNTPKDPNEVGEVSVSESKCNTISEECMNVPTPATNGTSVEAQPACAEDVKASDEKPAVKVEEVKPVEEVKEETVSKLGSSLLEKIQNKVNAKEASTPVANVADFNLSVDALAKVASEILNTEEGVNFATKLFRKKAGEEYAAAAIKEAAEHAAAFEKAEKEYNAKLTSQFDAHSKVASEVEGIELDVIKQAYAAGIEDANMLAEAPEVLEGAEEPINEEEAGEADITPEEIMEVLSELVEEGEIEEAVANQVAQELAEAAEEGVEENEEAMAQPEAPAAPLPVPAEEVAPEVPQGEPDANVAKLASEIILGTQLLKKASVEQGLLEEGTPEEADLEDVLSVVEGLVQEGSLDDATAKGVVSEIVNAISKENTPELSSDEISEDALADVLGNLIASGKISKQEVEQLIKEVTSEAADENAEQEQQKAEEAVEETAEPKEVEEAAKEVVEEAVEETAEPKDKELEEAAEKIASILK